MSSNSEVKQDRIFKIIQYLQSRSNSPQIGIVCGSGLGGLTQHVTNKTVIPYEDIPGFPRSTVVGHAGELVFGMLGGKNVICMRGRFHAYEGYAPAETAIGIRIFAALGVKVCIVTNAAGGVNPNFNVGDLMIIQDHVSIPGMAGNHPLHGPNDERFGVRFPPLNGCYTPSLIELARTVASEMKDGAPNLRQGTYCYVNGPSYETPSEVSFLRTLGGDTVGMSTINEVIVARHSGLQLLGLSLVTNRCLGRDDTGIPPSHKEVVDAVNAVQTKIQNLVKNIVSRIDTSGLESTRGGAYFSKIVSRM